MKPAVLKILTFSFILIISAASCKKSDPVSPVVPKSKTTLLTQTSWKLQSVGVDANKDGVVESDITSLVTTCKLDNVYTFKSDGTGSMDEGAAKCVSTDPQTQAFTWVFKSTETVLSGTFGFTNSGDATILSMDDTTLKVAYDDASTSSHLVAVLKH